LQKWNAGMTQAEIDRISEEKWEKKRLHEEDLHWKPLYPNNYIRNGQEGLYCLIFKKSENSIYCCKWTILFQMKEKEPLFETSEIEAYILLMKRYYDVKGPLKYPLPYSESFYGELFREQKKKTSRTFVASDVNDYGDFERAYKTLEEAKQGALHRCGCQGLNRETVIKKS
jgi:hypothetical protein